MDGREGERKRVNEGLGRWKQESKEKNLSSVTNTDEQKPGTCMLGAGEAEAENSPTSHWPTRLGNSTSFRLTVRCCLSE